MGVLDVAVVVAIITAFGGFAGGLVTLFSSKYQKVIDLIAERLATAERRLDALEVELAEERQRRMALVVYATALRAWAYRAWEVLRHHDIDFDEPPFWDPVANEDQMLVPDVERRHRRGKEEDTAR